MNLNTFLYLEYSMSDKPLVVLKDADSGENYGKKQYFKTLQEALDYCAYHMSESEFGVQLGRGFGELSEQKGGK